MNRRHVNEETSRQSNVAGDAVRPFCREAPWRFALQLPDRPEHFRDQLWTALRSAVTAIAALATAMGSCPWPEPGRRSNLPRPPRRSGRPPRSPLSPPRPRSLPPLRKGRWKRGRSFPPMLAESRGKSSRTPPACGARGSPGSRDRVLLRRGSCGDLLRFSFVAMVVMLRVLFGIFLVVLMSSS